MTRMRSRGWHARKHLVETIISTLDSNAELGYTRSATFPVLGRITLLRGSSEPRTQNSHLPVILTVLDRRAATGERVATLLTRGGIYARDELVLEPFHPNEWVIRGQTYMPVNDDHLTRRVSTSTYMREASENALIEFRQFPEEYGIRKEW